MAEGLAAYISKQRLKYLKSVTEDILNIIYESDFNPIQVYKKLIGAQTDSDNPEDILTVYFERGRQNEFYKSLLKKIKDPTIFHNLQNSGLFYRQEIYNDEIFSKLRVVESLLNENFSVITENIDTFPYFFEKHNKYDMNCVGTALTLGVLLYMTNNHNNASFVEVYKTKRRDISFEALKKLENEEFGEFGDFEIKKSGLERYKDLMPDYFIDGCVVKIDSFSGWHNRTELKERLANHIINLESKMHGIVKYKNRYLDLPEEWKNISGSNEFDLKKGLFLHSYLNLLELLSMFAHNNPFLQERIKNEFEQLYHDKNFKKSVHLNIFGLRYKYDECKNNIFEAYGSNPPINLSIFFREKEGESIEDILKNLPETLKKTIKIKYKV